MESRELKEEISTGPYFDVVPDTNVPESEVGTREMAALPPFVISGGRNTERYYFLHINDATSYKLIIKPEYFGDEASYTEVFPKRIREILRTNADARIFCAFDMDTVYSNSTRLEKHNVFIDSLKDEIANGTVTMCPSMPSIEYWFLLHFENYVNLLKNYSKVSGRLGKSFKDCFSDPTVPLKKLLKGEEHLKDATWVINLCADGKLEAAITRAKTNVEAAEKDGTLSLKSYTYIYKIFEEASKIAQP